MSERSVSVREKNSNAKLLNNPRFRAYAFQILFVVILIWIVWGIVSNTASNLEALGIASGFSFLYETTSIPVNFSPFVDYQPGTSTYLDIYWVGISNTLILAVVGIFFATIIGFLVGIARLSHNWVIGQMAYWYVEVLRNIPLLLQIFIWYKGVGAFLPAKRNPADLGIFGQLNAAGLFAPKPVFAEGADMVGWALLAAVAIAWGIGRRAKKHQIQTGQRFPVFWVAVGLIVVLPLIAYFAMGRPISTEYPTVGNFGPRGGMQVMPELIAMILALSLYTAAFIAEIVRAGVLAVNKGQTEASYALGLRRGQTLRLNIIPQAMRVIIPPLTSQYLNLTKNSSLAVAIAYADLTAIFAGVALNVKGQAVEFIFITMMTYLTISILTSMLMNWYNASMSLVER